MRSIGSLECIVFTFFFFFIILSRNINMVEIKRNYISAVVVSEINYFSVI